MRASKRRSSRRRSSRRSLRQNPLSTKQKVGVVGGLVVVGGAAAYMLTRSPAAPPPPPPLPPGAGGPTGAQCDALQASLSQLLAGPTPDAGEVARRRTAIAQCIAAVRAAGGEVSNLTTDMSNGDASYQHVEDQFADYKRTSKDDPLKRNNLRQDILTVGQAMAGQYAAAATAATDAATARAVRQSILRALDSSVSRQMCFLYQLDPQCGRNGVNEAHDNDKAGDEYARIISPLLDAHGLAVQKLWSLGGSATPDNPAFFTTLLRPALLAIDYANAKFNEYKSTDSGLDPARKNNIRQVVLAAGRAQVAALQYAFDAASGYKDSAGMRAVAVTILAALAPAITRWLCYLMGAQGCDTFALNEDQNRAKADQEYDATIGPLSGLYMQAAPKLVSWNVDLTAYEPLVTLKLRRCSALSDYVNAKFNEYKSVDSGLDPLRKNNLRQVVLSNGALLAACLQDAMSSALTGAAAQPPLLITQLTTSPGGIAAVRSALAPMMMTVPVPAASGLGIVLLRTPMLMAPMTITPTPTKTTTSTPSGPTGAALTVAVTGKRMIMAAVAVTKAALDASLTRQFCYRFGQAGCDTFAANEDSNAAKADQEASIIGAPLIVTLAQAAAFLNGKGDPAAEVELLKSKLQYCSALSNYVNAKFSEYKSVSWSDAVRRNNLRVGEVMAKGRDLVQCLLATAPKSSAGRTMVKTLVDAALVASQARVACYNDSSSPCGRFGGNEDDNATKATQETNDITNPLAAMSSKLASGQALSGMFDTEVAGLPVGAWLGAAALVGGVWWLSTSKKTVRNKRRRSSYRSVV